MEQINYIAVIVTAFVIQFIGFLWYSPFLFGTKWMKLLNTNPEQIKAMGKKPHLIALLTAFFMSFMMAFILLWTNTNNIVSAIGLATLIWFGVTLPDSIPHYKFAKLPLGILILDIFHTLSMLITSAIILTLWK
ncbi:DUF1761 domain-containing protein [Aureibaculum luteum]|uniref:DUF1761 domain-containing protein n=1 Tax=Aureibaculum luteum TaxID=1548456 RepID=UPI000E5522B1|nr:DUF1761 domain-containing protein [Aureibaculum luteum]